MKSSGCGGGGGGGVGDRHSGARATATGEVPADAGERLLLPVSIVACSCSRTGDSSLGERCVMKEVISAYFKKNEPAPVPSRFVVGKFVALWRAVEAVVVVSSAVFRVVRY